MTTSEIKMSQIVGGGYDEFWNCKKRYRVLKGGHCAGVSKRGDDGEFSVVKTVLAWLKGEREWML